MESPLTWLLFKLLFIHSCLLFVVMAVSYMMWGRWETNHVMILKYLPQWMPRDYTGKWVGGLPQCIASYRANEMEAIWSLLDNMISLLVCFTIATYNITVGLKARYKGRAAGDRRSDWTELEMLLWLWFWNNNATSISSSCITSSSGYVLSASRE